VQRLAWDVVEVAKLQEEVTVRAHTARVEETIWEKAALLEATRGKEAEAD
jgi:hypothetical protein